MSALEHCINMYDPKLKSRMLRTLIRDRLPDDDRPSPLPKTNLHDVISTVRTHKLLSESFPVSTDEKVVERWKSAVGQWVDRLLKLASSDMPDKCWTGICLLGLTCQECHVDRFSSSYSAWFDKLYSSIQQPADSQFVKVATFNSMADLLIRLGRLSNLKKDGNTLAGKLIQPVLKLLNEDSTDFVWEGAVHLLSTILTLFPASVHRYYDSAEAALASKILTGKCPTDKMKKLAYCLALLPNSKGDEDSWCLLMQKILLKINVRLNDIFQGLEEETKGSEAVRELVPPGKETPPPLGGHTLLEEATDKATTRSELLQMSSISMLILCCCKMLTSFYPVKVTAPIHPLLALVDRVIMVDGSVLHAALPYMISKQQEFVCLELPDLHLCSLELLKAIIEGMHSQLLPHIAYVVRLIKAYFKRCASPKLRIKLYSVMKSLLVFMGVGMGLCLAADVVENSIVDLNPVSDGSRCTSSSPNLKSASSLLMQSGHRKRKLSTTMSLQEQNEKFGVEVEAPEIYPSQISVKIAALEVLEVLLSVGGGLKFEAWRRDVDYLLFTVATDSCEDGWAYEESSTFLSNEPIITWADYQLAALRAFLASLLSPSRVRPPYLAQGRELFRKGKQEAGPKISGFCMTAVLALEALIHPRALALEQPSSEICNQRFPENGYSYGQKHSDLSTSGILGSEGGAPYSYDDDLYAKWVGNDNPSEAPMSGPTKNTDSVMPYETFGAHRTENLTITNSSGTEILDGSRQEQADGGTKNDDIGIATESQQVQGSVVQFQEPVSFKGTTDPGSYMEVDRTVPDGASDDKHRETASAGNLLTDNLNGRAGFGGNAPLTSYTEKDKAYVFGADEDSSMDSFPDIVDVEPDSDEEESS